MTELDTARPSRDRTASTGGSSTAWRPADTFADRLGRVRRHMGWNAAEASVECGFGRQNWRKWEVEGARPSDMAMVVEKIHTRTGVDLYWLMWGDGASPKPTGQYFGTALSAGCPGVMPDTAHAVTALLQAA